MTGARAPATETASRTAQRTRPSAERRGPRSRQRAPRPRRRILRALVGVALALVGGAIAVGIWSIRVGRLVVLGGTPSERVELHGLLGEEVLGGHPFLLGLGMLQARLREDPTLATEVRLVSLTRVGLHEEVLTVVPRLPVATLAGGLVVYRNGLVLNGGTGGDIVVCPTSASVPVASCATRLAPGARLSSALVATVAALWRARLAAVVGQTANGGVLVRLPNGAGCLLGRAERAAAEIAACRTFAGAGELVDVTNPNAPAGLGQLRVG